ncbi:MAG TPA: VOC family protein, partial [Bryobacteraceae bacterium]
MSTASSSPSATGLASAKIVAFVGTTQPESAKTFYGGTLGLRLVSEDGFAVVFDANGVMLRVAKVREIAAAQYTVLGWEVSDIFAKVKEMNQAGVQFERYSLPGQDELGI